VPSTELDLRPVITVANLWVWVPNRSSTSLTWGVASRWPSGVIVGHGGSTVVSGPPAVGFQKSVTYAAQQLYAARSYSLIKPPRTGRRLICS
jgi:hypothetical protein